MNRLQKKLLQEKLLANWHRRKREQVISSTGPELSAALSTAECITGPDAKAWLDQIPWPVYVDGRFVPQGLMEVRSRYLDWDDWSVARNQIQSLRGVPNVDAYLSLLDDGPVWRAPLDGYSGLIDDILAYSEQHRHSGFAWLSTNKRHGILLSQYCGFLPEERRTNYDEVVFELCYWGWTTSVDTH